MVFFTATTLYCTQRHARDVIDSGYRKLTSIRFSTYVCIYPALMFNKIS